jgi:hypothetical protein
MPGIVPTTDGLPIRPGPTGGAMIMLTDAKIEYLQSQVN